MDEVYVLAPQASFDADAPTQWATRLERQWRTRVTRRVLREAATIHQDGAEVTILGPGREDLEAMGGNLMDLSRRPSVIETSLRTSVAALRHPDQFPDRIKNEGGRSTVTRIYIPLNAAGLHSLSTQGAVQGSLFPAHAVTAALQASAPTAAQDELEYAALNDAAQTSGALLTDGESRRIVAAADVSSELVLSAAPGDSAVQSAVSIGDSVALNRIASFHVDDEDPQDDSLLWYDVTELPVILALL